MRREHRAHLYCSFHSFVMKGEISEPWKSNTSPIKTGWEFWFLSLEKAPGWPQCCFSIYISGSQKDGERLFFKVCSKKTRASGFKLKEGRLSLDTRKKFLMMGHWNKLLGVLDLFGCPKPGWMGLWIITSSRRQGVGWDDHKSLFQPKWFCHSMKYQSSAIFQPLLRDKNIHVFQEETGGPSYQDGQSFIRQEQRLLSRTTI